MEEAVIASKGHRVRTACDGAEALARCGQEIPRLVFVDYSMPRMDGLTFAAEFRKRYGRSGFLVLVSGDPDVATLAPAAGADAWLQKPFRITDFLEVVDRVLGEAGERGAV